MESTQNEVTPHVSGRKLSRREFLKTAGVLLGGTSLGLKRWLDENGPAAVLSSFLTHNIDRGIPTEFENEKEDPNPFFKNPDQILKDSFQLYDESKKEGSSEYPPLTFRKRKNYISTADVLEEYKGHKIEEIVNDIVSRQFSLGLDALRPEGNVFTIDQSKGGEILYFSGANVENISHLIEIDPGTGFINRAILKVFEVYRDDFYANHSVEKGFSEGITKKLQESITSELNDALNYFKVERAKRNTILELHDALVYFLKLNQGDVYAGLWDSVLFFKLFVRNNLNTLDFNPIIGQSMLLAELFKDSFSRKNSLNWLACKYREKNIGEKHLLGQPYATQDTERFKDFMIVNRGGGIYHGLNILTWSAVCMDPILVKMVTSAHSSWQVNDATAVTEHGEIKIDSDLTVALKSSDVRKVVDSFVKKD